MNTWKEKLLKQISLKVLVVAALFLVSLFVFSFIADEAVLEQEDTFDKSVHLFFLAHSTPRFIQVMQDFTFLGSSYVLFPAYIILVLFFVIKKKFRSATDIAVVALSSFAVMQVLKQIFHRKRPDLPIIKGITSYSFPSGHTLSSFIFCSIAAYIVWQSTLQTVYKILLSILLLSLAITIGISRIVLNVHYATDVIAGFCLGVMWVILSFAVIRKINKHRAL